MLLPLQKIEKSLVEGEKSFHEIFKNFYEETKVSNKKFKAKNKLLFSSQLFSQFIKIQTKIFMKILTFYEFMTRKFFFIVDNNLIFWAVSKKNFKLPARQFCVTFIKFPFLFLQLS